MAHAQKPDIICRRNGRVHLNRQGRQFSRLLAAEVCASAAVMLDTPCSEVECKTTGYPLHSPVSRSLLLPCVTVCHHISTGVYFCIYFYVYYDALALSLKIPSCYHLPEDGGHKQETCTRACRFRENVIFYIMYVRLLVHKIHYSSIITCLKKLTSLSKSKL